MLPKLDSYQPWVRCIVLFMKFWFFIYDILVYIPFQLFSNPDEKLKKSNRIKAKPTIEGDNSSPWRSADCPQEGLVKEMFPGCNTLAKVWKRSATIYGPNRCLGQREIIAVEQEKQKSGKVFAKYDLGEYKWLSFSEVSDSADNIGSGLLALGHKTGHNMVIFCDTRVEWMITAIGCFNYGIPVTTVYATLGDDMIIHAINESDAETIVTNADLVQKIIKLLPELTQVKRLVYFPSLEPKSEDPINTTVAKLPDGFRLISLKDLETLGADKALAPEVTPKPDDTAVIMYTSGTTGVPKGVIITHQNLVAANAGQCEAIPDLNPDKDVYVGYLPLAHVLELGVELDCLSSGVPIGYSSPATLTDTASKVKRGCKGDLAVLQPTLMATVPTICDRLYKAIVDKVNGSSPIRQAVFHLFYERKRERLESGYDNPFLNRIIFRPIRALIGGRVRVMFCGGAPLDAETQRFMNICFCCPVGQGYGLTETCGAATLCDIKDLSTGRVGAPLICNDIMLREWSEAGYSAKNLPNPQGEILISGANVVKGYFKQEAKTKEDFITIAGRRWFCTGDIGEFHQDGVLKIIDRKKDLLKLSHGEYVSLAKVETALLTCPLVDNICAYGNSFHANLIALVVPNKKNLVDMATKMNIDTSDWSKLCKDKNLTTAALTEIEKYAKQRKLEKFEVPTKILLCEEIWTAESGLLTEALKLKRKPIETHYRAQLDDLYKH